MNKPNNVSDSPGLLPYGRNFGARAVEVTNIKQWKELRILNGHHQFENKF